MDFSLLWALLVVAIILAATITFKILQSKGIIRFTKDDVIEFAMLFNLTMDIVDELDLKYESRIKEIGNIVASALAYAEKQFDDVDKEKNAVAFAFELCDKFAIELTDARKKIIEKLIHMGLEKA